jgi:glutamate-5-semialdehyde dehydrogenase
MDDVRQMARDARRVSRQLAMATTAQRNAALLAITRALEQRREEIVAANALDLARAEEAVARGVLGEPLLKRLSLAGRKYDSLGEMVFSVMQQPDPLNATQAATELDTGLELYRISVPIGVIGVIFESRPDALVQIAALALKAGNAVLLKGGREAAGSNRILAEVINTATTCCEGIPPGWLGLLAGREEVSVLLEMDEDVDLIIPRGSNEFVQFIMNNTRIAVMGHADGICHVYVDRAADVAMAVRIAVDSKTQYVAVCNAAETLLVHRDVAATFMAQAVPALRDKGVELRGCARACALAPDAVQPAAEEDWRTEYLDLVLSVRVVDDLAQAADHINEFGSHHTDTIVTADAAAATAFLRGVDSASVMHNASTRFADGFRYGLGAEVGVSTSRLHSRGPVGLEGLTSYKYLLQGQGQIVDDYEGDANRPYTHRRLQRQWNGQ